MRRSPVALLIVRATVEPGSSAPLRATVRLTADTTSGFTKQLLLSDPTDVTDVVRAWLEQVLADR